VWPPAIPADYPLLLLLLQLLLPHLPHLLEEAPTCSQAQEDQPTAQQA
jgi:hypothetical protein